MCPSFRLPCKGAPGGYASHKTEQDNGFVWCDFAAAATCWLQEPKEIDAYQSDPTKEKSGRKSAIYGPEMLETWLLLEFCDR